MASTQKIKVNVDAGGHLCSVTLTFPASLSDVHTLIQEELEHRGIVLSECPFIEISSVEPVGA